ncbi:hypothetical protein D3C73_1588060 [compost metagenome]
MEPSNTGDSKYDQPLPAMITKMGSAPAGGCVVLVSIIAAIAVPAANPVTHTP